MKNLCALIVALFLMNGALAQWTSQSIPGVDILTSVFFVNNDIGYAVEMESYGGERFDNDSAFIIKTTDGGEHWSKIYFQLFGSFMSVFFTDCNSGYVGGAYFIWKTTDGGISWLQQLNGWEIHSIYFVNDNTGYAVGGSFGIFPPFISDRIILKTTNGGADWVVQFHVQGPMYNSIEGVYFVNVDTGYAVGGDAFFKTLDGGNTWQEIALVSIQGNSVHFTSVDTGFVGGAGGIWKTTDGGSTWVLRATPLRIFSIYFTDNSTGYAVGEGEALKTTDSGENWFSMIDDSRIFRGIHFPSIDAGFIVADSGTIYKTTNGGGFPVGFGEQSKKANKLTIYPNPASSTITIETRSKGIVSILNISGQAILQQDFTEPYKAIDVRTLPSGIYVVKIIGEEGVQVGKFIKR